VHLEAQLKRSNNNGVKIVTTELTFQSDHWITKTSQSTGNIYNIFSMTIQNDGCKENKKQCN